MREIKFRGKRLDNGAWIYGSHLADGENHVIANVQCGVFFSGQTAGETCYRFNGREVDPETVGQFTGLKDMEGQDIYEGDILEYAKIVYTDCSQSEIEEVLEPGLIELIQHRPLAAIVKPLTGNVRAFAWDCETREGLLIDLTSQEVEIVGNVYDDHELIERSRKAQLPD